MSYYLTRLLFHPLVLAGIVAAGAALYWKVLGPIAVRQKAGMWGAVAGGAAILAYLALTGWYAYGVRFIDHVEPEVISVAWAYHAGQPLFNAPDAPARYTIEYGPALYLIEAAWLPLTGPILEWAKVPTVLASVLSVGLLGLLVARHLGWARALAVTGTLCAVLLDFNGAAFWLRPDPLLLLAMTGAVIAAEAMPRRTGILVFGLTMGLAPLLKIYAVIYFLPLIPLIWRRWGKSAPFLAGLVAALVAASPFLILPRVSLSSHLHWILLARRHGFDLVLFRFNIEYALFYLLPLLALGWLGKLQIDVVEWLCLGLAVAGAVLMGSKTGAGRHYLIPLLPILLMLMLRRPEAGLPALCTQILIVFGLTSAALAAYQCALFVQNMAAQRYSPEAEQELLGVIHRHPKEWMAMGSEAFDPLDPAMALTYLRPLLLFAGSPLEIDPAAMIDMTADQIVYPEQTLAIFDRGEYVYWIFPAGEQPFKAFPYPDAFRAHFVDHYQLSEHGRYFDLWSYKSQADAIRIK